MTPEDFTEREAYKADLDKAKKDIFLTLLIWEK